MFAAREQAGSLGTQIQARHCRPFFASASFTISVVIYFCIVEVSLEQRMGGGEGKNLQKDIHTKPNRHTVRQDHNKGGVQFPLQCYHLSGKSEESFQVNVQK
jgi:hypothetical protein